MAILNDKRIMLVGLKGAPGEKGEPGGVLTETEIREIVFEEIVDSSATWHEMTFPEDGYDDFKGEYQIARANYKLTKPLKIRGSYNTHDNDHNIVNVSFDTVVGWDRVSTTDTETITVDGMTITYTYVNGDGTEYTDIKLTRAGNSVYPDFCGWVSLSCAVVQNESGSGGSVELDDTLTVEGKAADAKAVGDALVDKVGFTDYVSGSTAGIITAWGQYGIRNLGTELGGIGRTVDQYNKAQDYYIICKNTLERIKYDYVAKTLTGKATVDGVTTYGNHTIVLTEEEINALQEWLGITDKLSNKVGFYDFLDKGKYENGEVVELSNVPIYLRTSGGIVIKTAPDGSGRKVLSVEFANDTQVKNRADNMPLKTNQISAIVRSGVIGCSGGTSYPLTEEEQTKAQAWLGISGGNSGSANELEWISLGVYTLETEMGQDENTGINYSVAVPKMINVFGTAYLNRPWDFADGTPGSSYDDVSFNALIPCSKFGRVDFSTIAYNSYSGYTYQIIGSVNVTKTTEDDGSVTVKSVPYIRTIKDILDRSTYDIDYTQGYSYETKILTYKD